mmetsp:Transcript_59836/g.174883  ORF Transcript_59836/g.174883 Transcript_59836/m.174883 type:complete len:258 (+) Transcript_59836:377-1150(+)
MPFKTRTLHSSVPRNVGLTVKVPVPRAEQAEEKGQRSAPWQACGWETVPEPVARGVQQACQESLRESHVHVGHEDGQHLQRREPPWMPRRGPPLARDHHLEHHRVGRGVHREEADAPGEAVREHLLRRPGSRPELLHGGHAAPDPVAAQDVGQGAERQGQEDQQADPVANPSDVADVPFDVIGQVCSDEAVEGLDGVRSTFVELGHKVVDLCPVSFHLALCVLEPEPVKLKQHLSMMVDLASKGKIAEWYSRQRADE